MLTYSETNEANLTKAPEIIMEIISKSTAIKDEICKVGLNYQAQKAMHCIISYPDDLIATVYKFDGKA